MAVPGVIVRMIEVSYLLSAPKLAFTIATETDHNRLPFRQLQPGTSLPFKIPTNSDSESAKWCTFEARCGFPLNAHFTLY